jgi:hypothetical protein
LTSTGLSAFSDYARGKTQAHKSIVLSLKLFDRHPELLKELAKNEQVPGMSGIEEHATF